MEVGLPLAGKTIVITRPQRQSVSICKRLKTLGARVVEFPLIAIEPPLENSIYQSQLSNLTTYDYLIFTSRNSVDMTFQALQSLFSRHDSLKLFTNLQIAAVGQQTSDALEKQGVKVSIVPNATFNSEALLKLEALQEVDSKRIAIIRGEGGRDLLRSTLATRGAVVEYVDVYRRICPLNNLLPLVNCQKQNGIDIIALTSVEGLLNLFKLGAGHTWLEQITLLVGSERIAGAIQHTNHVGKVIIADNPSDEQMVDCMLNWATNSI